MFDRMFWNGKALRVALLAGAALVSTSRCGSAPAEAVTAEVDVDVRAAIERGRYLVTIGGCNDCHTPWIPTERGPEPDMTRMLSGHPESVPMPEPPSLTGGWGWAGAATNTAFAGPWGVSFAFNLTPDENTGIGIWTEEMFIQTLRTGRHMGVSRPILPPMPWFNYGKMTDEDLKAVYAFLRSIPPVHNRVPTPIEPHELAAMPK